MFQEGGKAAVAVRPQRIDICVLQQVIEGLEEGLKLKRKRIEPAKKAELISLLYDHFTESRKDVDKEIVERYLKLVS